MLVYLECYLGAFLIDDDKERHGNKVELLPQCKNKRQEGIRVPLLEYTRMQVKGVDHVYDHILLPA